MTCGRASGARRWLAWLVFLTAISGCRYNDSPPGPAPSDCSPDTYRQIVRTFKVTELETEKVLSETCFVVNSFPILWDIVALTGQRISVYMRSGVPWKCLTGGTTAVWCAQEMKWSDNFTDFRGLSPLDAGTLPVEFLGYELVNPVLERLDLAVISEGDFFMDYKQSPHERHLRIVFPKDTDDAGTE